MKTLVILAILTAGASAQPATAPVPKYRTAQDFKILWYNQFKIPSQLHRDYRGAIQARQQFVMQVRAGTLDLRASRDAAAYNAELAIQSGDTEKATHYQAEVVRIDQQVAEAKRAREAAELNRRLAEIRDQMGQLNNPTAYPVILPSVPEVVAPEPVEKSQRICHPHPALSAPP